MLRFVMVVGCLAASLVRAQDADGGAPLEPSQPDAGTPLAAVVVAPPAPAPVSAPAPVPVAAPTPPSAEERVRGHFGFGFLGTASVLRASEDALGTQLPGQQQRFVPFTRVTVPLLGVRWWTPVRRLGLEAGVGVMVSDASADVPVTNGSDIQLGPTTTELVFHLAAPIVLGSTEHMIVFLAPELRAGRSTRDDVGAKDPLLSMTWDASLRAGVEIFFSFIGLPNLSLEAGVRAGFTHEVRTFTTGSEPLSGPVREGRRTLSRFSTSLVANPWDLFTSTLAARYYF